ncbi:FKBP-type peptidyl-prolyl cis-trans isomerase [Candidatus Dojkabacteria bacterium]|uniref:Peptidyl-prolyl cis-trans isomerase n=1 Tax=Candidatus Dojkabacteria bacterium TaxID=2099670 RepID=A0A955L9A9_9BACT|nr:FKBP-type peptidyl-prolyl cis-trans isomerase [Candidatus Dojkabacteria bacterium]
MTVTLLAIILAACTTVPDYRNEGATEPTIESEVEVPSPEGTTDVQTIEPQEDYSEYENASELQILNYLESDSGITSENGDTISVHYVGFLPDGTNFDSSLTRGVPFSFELGAGEVIEGWDEAFLDKHIGDVFTVIIPSDKAYGSIARPGIPADSTLVFEVEIMDVIKSS